MARPTKLTSEIQQRLCVHLQYGASEKMAAEAEGLHEDTLANWRARHPGFLAAVRQAKAVARTEKLRLLHVAACRGNVQAITWLLERLEPQHFGKVATELPALLTNLLERLEPQDAARVLLAWGLGPQLLGAGQASAASQDDALEGDVIGHDPESTPAPGAQGG